MSRAARLLLILAAWAVPVVWVGAELGTRPSDGTVVWSSPLTGGEPWDSTISVRATYGSSELLQPGDVLTSIDGVPVARWLDDGGSAERAIGDKVLYHLERVQDGILLGYDREVTLSRFPLAAALKTDLPIVLTGLLLLVAGGVAFFLRPGMVAARALLGSTSLVPTGLASSPWGLGAIDLAGGRGYWPHIVSEVACATGLGLAVLAAVTLRAPRGWLVRHAWVGPACVLVPFGGYAVWAAFASGIDGPARIQALLSVAAPAVVVVLPTILAVLVVTYRRSRTREVRLAARTALMALAAGLAVRLLLGELPARLTGEPVLPLDVLLLLVAPPVLAALVVAVVGYRLDDVEPAVRRTVVQGSVAALVGATFVVVAAAIGQTTDVPVGAMLAGGLVALLVLPVAVAIQRGVRRLAYGEPDLPRSVVTDLRQLDAEASASAALTETLAVLSRRLRLVHARIEVPEGRGGGPLTVSVGEPGTGTPTVVDIVAGGTSLGSLQLETDPGRDPFGRGDRRLLEDVGAQVGALVQTVLVNVELRRSRQALVTAREEERRRLRRDLHDGLGPSLATLAMSLEAAQELIESDPGQAVVLVGGLADDVRDDIAEVRRLVEGLRPAALDQLGLVSALNQRAAQHAMSVGDRGLVWTVDADQHLGLLPAAVEVAAYRIALEAVTNAVRHSGASACTVTVRRADDHLVVKVQDDGAGLVEDRHAGVGLTSMEERARELGGTCTVSSSDSGTTVEARLPLGVVEAS
jgi:signal transduction histidine kinase